MKQSESSTSKFNFKFNQQGIAFVEIIISISLMLGLGLIAMNLTKQSNKSSAKYQFDTEINLITNEIIGILSDPNKCLTTFTNATQLNSAPIPTVASTPFNVTSPTGIAGIPSTIRKFSLDGGPYGNAGVKIDSYKLDLSTSPDPQLVINFKNKSILGFGTTTKTINLYIEKNDSSHPGLITFCKPASSNFNTSSSEGIKMIDETQAITCTASNEGSMRYNKSSHALEFCGFIAGPPTSYLWKRVSSPHTTLVLENPKIHSVTDGGGSWSDNCPPGALMTGVGVYGNTMYTYCSKLTHDGSFNLIALSSKPQAHSVNDGGSSWSDNCNAGHVITGISISNNTMKLYCSSISKDYLYTLTADPSGPKTHQVNDGGGSWTDQCNLGSAVIGLTIHENNMTLQCAKFQTQ